MRHVLTLILAASLALSAADARPLRGYVQGAMPAYPPVTPTVSVHGGQSWAVNLFGCMGGVGGYANGCYGINTESDTFLTFGISNPNYPSGVMPAGMGINMPAQPNGLVYYTPSMLGLGGYPGAAATHDTGSSLYIGDAADLTQTVLRKLNGKTVTPIIGFNVACPSSDWYSGPCGGLGPSGASFNASLNATTQVLTVSPGVTGTILPGAAVQCTGCVFNQSIASQISGTTGADGTYSVGRGLPLQQNVSSEAITTVSDPWNSLEQAKTWLAANTPTTHPYFLNAAAYKNFDYTQGGALDGTYADTTSQLTQMESDVDSLLGNTIGYYIGVRGAVSTWTVMSAQVQGFVDFVRANANSRTHGTNPWYQYPYNFQGASNIHLGDYGTICGLGQFLGYARYVTEDEGTFFKPLWQSLTNSVTLSGNVLTIPFDRPTGTAFASSVLQFAATPNEGISIAFQDGFDVQDNGVEDPITNVAISGLNVQLTLQNTPAHGDSVMYAYAWYGPGGFSQGQSGVWGNLMMAGPPSVFPWCATQSTLGSTINAWAWPIEPTTITAP